MNDGFSTVALFLILMFSTQAAYAIGVGISPDELSFSSSQKEARIFIFNKNSRTMDYAIDSCDYGFIETLRRGSMQPDSGKEIEIRYNPGLNHNVTSCSFQISIVNADYSTALLMPVRFILSDEDILNPLFESPDKIHVEEKARFKYPAIIIASILLAISIFVTIRFF